MAGRWDFFKEEIRFSPLNGLSQAWFIQPAYQTDPVPLKALTGYTFKGAQIMTSIATTRMSSKGQVVIPEEIRKSMKLNPGEQFVVLSEKDVIILKTVAPPSLTEFDELIQTARIQARKAGLKKSDITKVVKKARSKT